MSETERLEVLAGLKGSRTRVLELQLAMETLVERMAADDPLAAHLVDELAPNGGGTTEFISNQTLARCEERLALAVPRPTSLISITGLN